LLSEEEDHPETVPQPATKSQNTGKTVRFAELPHVNRLQKTPKTTKSDPPSRSMRQKNGQQLWTQPPSMDSAQPRASQAPLHGAPTPRLPPLAPLLPPKQLWKQTPSSGQSSTAIRILTPRTALPQTESAPTGPSLTPRRTTSIGLSNGSMPAPLPPRPLGLSSNGSVLPHPPHARVE